MRPMAVLLVQTLLLTLPSPGAARTAGWSEAPQELVDPWAPRASRPSRPTAKWVVPEAAELLDPWKQTRRRHTPRFVIIDPWEGRPPGIPTAAFPPVSLIDPWHQRR